jgi:hypothetical protein
LDAPSDPHLKAEVGTLRARILRSRGKVDEALAEAIRAKAAALEAIAPVSYFAAAVETAEALATKDDLAGAYGAVAAAWVPTADLLGRDVAKSWIEPVLLAYRARWGEPAFNGAKRTYEDRRRMELREDSR